jgi:hypothetical protein
MPTPTLNAERYATERLWLDGLLSRPAAEGLDWQPDCHFTAGFAQKVDKQGCLPSSGSILEEEAILREGLAYAYFRNPLAVVAPFTEEKSPWFIPSVAGDLRRYSGKDITFTPQSLEWYAINLGSGPQSAIATWEPDQASSYRHIRNEIEGTLRPAFHSYLEEIKAPGYTEATEARGRFEDYTRAARSGITDQLALKEIEHPAPPVHEPSVLSPADKELLAIAGSFNMPPAIGEPYLAIGETSSQLGVGGSDKRVPVLRRNMLPLAGLLDQASREDVPLHFLTPDGWVGERPPGNSAPSFMAVTSASRVVNLASQSRLQPAKSTVLEFPAENAKELGGILARIGSVPPTVSNGDLLREAVQETQAGPLAITPGHFRIMVAGQSAKKLDNEGPSVDLGGPEMRPGA